MQERNGKNYCEPLVPTSPSCRGTIFWKCFPPFWNVLTGEYFIVCPSLTTSPETGFAFAEACVFLFRLLVYPLGIGSISIMDIAIAHRKYFSPPAGSFLFAEEKFALLLVILLPFLEGSGCLIRPVWCLILGACFISISCN
jgi:hypothetical protein